MASSVLALGAVAASTTTARAETTPTSGWTPEAQAQAQGFWIVVSDTPPTVTTRYGVPVVWISADEVAAPIPVQPANPAFDNATSRYTIPAAQVGIDYYVQHEYPVGTAPTAWALVGPGPYTIPPASLPSLTTVQARARTGYVTPGTYQWSHNFPDPKATVVVTSDGFSGANTTTLNGRRTDVVLGGTAAQWADQNNVLRIVNGRMTTSATTGGASLPVGALHQEVEFDLAVSGAVTLDRFHINVSGNGGWNNGFGLNLNCTAAGDDNGTRVYDNGALIGQARAGKMVGHYKISVVNTTATVTWPGGTTSTFTVAARATGQTKISFQGWAASTPGLVTVDNLVCRRVGY